MTATTLPSDATAIRPFQVDVPEQTLVELKRRVAATQWPEQELVTDRSQGCSSRRCRSWRAVGRPSTTGVSARRSSTRFPSSGPRSTASRIHFIHVRSRHDNALPLIMSHGWPGSVIELLEVIGPLTDPTAHGGRAEDAFDLVLPSLPGYGFSGSRRKSAGIQAAPRGRGRS